MPAFLRNPPWEITLPPLPVPSLRSESQSFLSGTSWRSHWPRIYLWVSLLHSSAPHKERRQWKNFKEKGLETGDPPEPREKQSEASTAAALHRHPYGGDGAGPPGAGGRSCLSWCPRDWNEVLLDRTEPERPLRATSQDAKGPRGPGGLPWGGAWWLCGNKVEFSSTCLFPQVWLSSGTVSLLPGTAGSSAPASVHRWKEKEIQAGVPVALMQKTTPGRGNPSRRSCPGEASAIRRAAGLRGWSSPWCRESVARVVHRACHAGSPIWSAVSLGR